ncbi:transcription factor complex helicase XPB subunit [Seminavis robusta]|uniref:DNA 3'-5' helicase n=1 Tax=Seminavis robusta TaxID=568900 RepID=A0A9N8EYG3_9STRA|nr:transcription factor complex helicase XPB subunit [Seminavis robusta]|eukprot:Sro2184_g318120.1 transcription factor complex helicase XPB subunit (768) ;mRNA; r:14779-17179
MDDGETGGAAEYASARKLVLRAAKRETALTAVGDPNSPFGADFSKMPLKPDHCQRPCWSCPDGTIYLEAFHDLYASAYDFLVAIAEPVARPEFLHQYKLTPYSLYAAVATNIETEAIISVLDRMSKNKLPKQVKAFVRDCTQKYGKAKLVLKHNKFYVESEFHTVLRELLRDPVIAQARVTEDANTEVDEHGFVKQTKAEEMKENLHIIEEPEDDSDEEEEEGQQAGQKKGTKQVVSFQVKGELVEQVKRQAIELDYPLMDEYDFRNDKINPDVPKMDLKPHTRIRRYQERALAKMFGNGRARSGIIVLPCGAGKTLTGVTAAQTIKKSVVCLATNAVSVLQWKFQFQLWTNIPDANIAVFTSDRKDTIHPEACVLVTTYTMIAFAGKRSEKAQETMDIITSREWGLLLMDEVHVVPAKMFRRVVGSVKAHCRLGLTATLVREDDLISDLNFLIGPKLYEANWMDLTTQGYLANVQCVEIWCPMTGPFMKEYLMASNARLKQLLYVMNPSKIRAVQFLVKFHEERGDKIIVFSDLVYSLKLYAEMLKKPLIYGETPERERAAILGTFRATDAIRTICISKVGDTSIDLPEANVVVQVSSHFGSRRQEAQRLGRILRPKSYTQQDGSNRNTFNAFFYTLVSSDTQEMFYSAKRQQFLIDQGYTFKVVTNLCEKADAQALESGFNFSTPEHDRKLLRTVLTAETSLEKEQRDEDNAIRKNNPDGAALSDAKVKRSAGSMATLSGGSGMRYREISSGSKKHPLFRKRQRR